MQPNNSTEQVSGLIKCVAAQNGTVQTSTFGGGHGKCMPPYTRAGFSVRLTYTPGYATYALGGPDGFMILGLLQRLR